MAGEINRKIKKSGKFMAIDCTVGACSVNCTYGDQIRKIREEVSEINQSLIEYTGALDKSKKGEEALNVVESKWNTLEECCDAITAIFTLINMLGFDSWNVCNQMEEVRKKNLKRGYLK